MANDKENDAETSAVIIGDNNCGKTTLCAAYLDKVFPTHRAMPMYEFDARQATVDLDGYATKLVLRDGSVLEYHERLRPLAYRKASVGIVCFGIDNPMSLENVSRKWYPDIVRYAPGLPLVLAGLKLDLRNDMDVVENLAKSGTHPVTETEGRLMAKRIGAKAYVECSALDYRGIDRIFQCGAQVAVIPKDSNHRCNQPDRAQCIIQ